MSQFVILLAISLMEIKPNFFTFYGVCLSVFCTLSACNRVPLSVYSETQLLLLLIFALKKLVLSKLEERVLPLKRNMFGG